MSYREEWEKDYPRHQTRFLAYCRATGTDPEADEFAGNKFMAFINHHAGNYKKAASIDRIMDHDDFTAYLWALEIEVVKEHTHD